MDRIKRLSMEILNQHKSKFGLDFTDNKKTLNQISVIRSKGLKNEIAGYITKFIKHEIHDQQLKEKRAKQSSQISEIEEQHNPEMSKVEETKETQENPIEQKSEEPTKD